MKQPRAPEGAALSEPGRDRAQPLAPIDLDIEERVEVVETRHPAGDGPSERPGLQGQLTLDRNPAADRREGLSSVSTRFGERGAFWGARLLHVLTVALLVAAGLGLEVGVFYWLGVAAVAGLLLYEHSLVRPGDLRRLDTAFFTMNGVISLAFFGFVLADALV